MDDIDANRQIDQMISFIINEAKDKAAEIEYKAYEDYNMEKLKTLQTLKEAIISEIEIKEKIEKSKRAVEKSKHITKSRILVLNTFYKCLNEIYKSVNDSFASLHMDVKLYSQLCTDLIVEGMIILNSEKVLVKVRSSDYKTISNIAENAQTKFKEIMNNIDIHNIDPSVVVLDNEFLLEYNQDNPESCVGGVVVITLDKLLSCDNTLNKRLEIVYKKCMPVIRECFLS